MTSFKMWNVFQEFQNIQESKICNSFSFVNIDNLVWQKLNDRKLLANLSN